MQSGRPWLAEAVRRPGARLIWASTAGLAVLALATFYVSFRAQFTFMYAVKHQDLPALIEALIADVAMVTCSLLALGMACAGQSAKVARLLVVVFAGLSAGMNYLAADVTSFRSVAVYVMPPVVFAVCTDQTVAVIRRHGLGIAEDSAWTVLGRLVLAAARLAGIFLLYALRFILAPAETATGLRRMVLDAAPLPGAVQDRPAPEATSETSPVPRGAPGVISEAAPELLFAAPLPWLELRDVARALSLRYPAIDPAPMASLGRRRGGRRRARRRRHTGRRGVRAAGRARPPGARPRLGRTPVLCQHLGLRGRGPGQGRAPAFAL